MNGTKALTQLGFVTARGLDNGEYGAQLLANKVRTRVATNSEYGLNTKYIRF